MSDYQYYNQNQNRNGSGNNQGGNNNNNNNFDWVSWAIIAFLFATGLWFVALPMLFIKLFAPDNKKRSAPPPLYKPNPTQTASKSQTARPAYQARSAAEAKPDSKARGVVRDMARSPKSSSGSAILLMVFGAVIAVAGAFSLIDPVDMAIWAGSLDGYYLKEILQWLAVSAGGVAMFFGGLNIKRSMKRYLKYMAVIGSLEAISIEALSRKLGYSKRRVTKDLQKMIDKGYFGPSAYLNMELGYLFLTSKADAEISALRNAAEEKTEQAQNAQSADEYSVILQNIRSANDRIADPVLSEKIDRLEAVTAQIFKAVESDPKKRHKIDTFLSYYLPTTQKLLDSYAKFEASGVEGENMRQSKQSIQSAMDSIIHGFECQLDELYKNDAMDIEADIRVMQKMLDREKSTAASDFKLNSETKPESAPKETPTDAPKDVDLGGGVAGQEK